MCTVVQICDTYINNCCYAKVNYNNESSGSCTNPSGTQQFSFIRLTDNYNNSYACGNGIFQVTYPNNSVPLPSVSGKTCLTYATGATWVAYWSFHDAEGCMN